MTENYTYVFQYLERQQVSIDKKEFEFQLLSHPDYPSILAISDTLNFFNIETFVARVGFEDLDDLPDRFIAHLNTELSNPQLYFIERIGSQYYHIIDKKPLEITKTELEKRWTSIVLLIEKLENDEILKSNKSNWSLVLQSISLLLFVLVLSQIETDYKSKIFLVFPIIGLLFSIAALKDLFGTKSELLNNFCNITASTSCTSVIGSSRWKIFKIVNFGDLSMVFFTSQFLGLLIFLFSGDAITYFIIQKGLLLCAIPVLLLSLYYQKFVEKKWCPICLVIIIIILLELVYLFILKNDNLVVSVSSIILFLLVFVSVIITWSALKKIFTQQKELKEFQLESIRFARNYTVFKNSLLASGKVNYQSLSSGNLIVGNENANLKITIVSNPFCGYCASVHILIEEILKKHKDTICIDIRFNFNAKQSDEQSAKVHRKFVRIYYDKGQEALLKALNDWFENKDESKLVVSANSVIHDLKINKILHEQFSMNQANNISFTPTIIINQYQFPKMYDQKKLIHFISDLLEDEDFFVMKPIEEECSEIAKNC
jgi:protein-disulfide isomerase